MVRKSTLILLIVFAVLVGLAYYLQQNPLPEASSTPAAPSATAEGPVLPGWQSSDIAAVELASMDGTVELVQTADSSVWTMGPDGPEIELSLVEQVRSQLVAATVQASLPEGYARQALGLEPPVSTLTLRGAGDRQARIYIGAKTPTGNGYYVQVDEQEPVVVSSMAIDTVLDLLRTAETSVVTPAPETTGTAPPATPVP